MAKRAEVGTQALSVRREEKQTAEESGARRGFERGCVRGGFPCTLKGDVSVSSFTWWRVIMESCPYGQEAREPVGPRKLLWCGEKK